MGRAFTSASGIAQGFTGAEGIDGLTPPILAASVNDYDPRGGRTVSAFLLTASIAVNITGIAGSFPNRELRLVNAGSIDITLTGDSAASIAANRFNFVDSVILRAGAVIALLGNPSGGWNLESYSAGRSGTQILLSGTITPAQITANTNNYAPTGFAGANVVRVSFNASMPVLSGLDATGINDGAVRVFENVGSTTGLLTDQDANSTAANRFDLGGNDLPLFARDSIALVYDLTSARWRPLNNRNANLRPPAELGFFAYNDWLRVFDDSVTATGGTVTPTQPVPNGVVGHPGFLRYTSAGAGSSSGLFSWSEDFVLLGNNWFWRFREALRVTTLSTAAQRFIQTDGFLDNGVAGGSPIDGCFFRYSDNLSAGNWQCVCATNSVETVADSGIPVVAGTWYALDVRVFPAGNLARFYINGALVASVTTNIPTAVGRETGFGGYIRKTVGATARTVDSDYFDVYGYANQARA